MKNIALRIVSENTWLFPTDTVDTPCDTVSLYAARGGNVLFQVLTDEVVAEGTPFSYSISGANGITVTPYRLTAVNVPKNSAPRGKMQTAEKYEDVKDFVTKEAPFDVYDITDEIGDTLTAGHLAFAVRLSVAKDAPVGTQTIRLALQVGDGVAEMTVTLAVHKAIIPPLEKSDLWVCNWIYPAHIKNGHAVEIYSDKYYEIYRRYLSHLLDIRSNHLCLMGVEVTPIRDENEKIVDFDLSILEKHLKIADEMGFTALYGAFIARWHHWTNDNLYLLWDNDVAVTDREAYRQLALYLPRLREMIERNGWEDKFIQPLVDEPQVNNERPYRILAAIFRKFIPYIPTHDPLETTDVGGGPDIWCVKQAIYEKYIDIYREYQAMGETFTYYTCGYPAGDHMNRVLDLPLCVGRLSFWMCHRYGFHGFLHWGYHAYANREQTLRVGPAGNQNIVYPIGDTLADTVRSHGQRAGAEDWELFTQLKKYAPERADALIERGCRTFTDYERDGLVVEEIRKELLLALDEYL